MEHEKISDIIGANLFTNSIFSESGSLKMHIQRVVPSSINKAIKEVCPGILEHSVGIATQKTMEIVMEDFANEPDETRILNAAHEMVASLAGSLAHVKCKEPLRTSISSQLWSSLQSLNIASDILAEAVRLVINDNLDLACAVIEQAAIDKAISTIDTKIAQNLSARRKHRQDMK